jgi:hypothetical protein
MEPGQEPFSSKFLFFLAFSLFTILSGIIVVLYASIVVHILPVCSEITVSV